MKSKIEQVFKNTIIILIAVFLCVPCSVKAEIKQNLNTSAFTLENIVKPNKTVVCQFFTKVDTAKTTNVHQKKILQENNKYFNNYTFLSTNLQRSILFSIDTKPAVYVPIYILHEQYLI